ncbi:Crinkler (CRN) family protein [Phytophthora infestans T30-4]|uniref:Crinkler (CRN) family protein n=1 Tax=Phytophthora infestans (strain T30-4) TaxID=403677 RepID=D0N8I2_PHYIT|nr:Crinkler (CRN) family protein [Phytophthora infestans T30-4]EEY53867.1 Crinkler (CRN) family protein [Phytophthora infestans T30-4]|eukprot:XP_002904498.1 Crinkler (CRN) family protein [Phytophthora infestans T30-4]
MVKLFCAVIRVGSVFSVNIELSETVSDLKEKIKGEKPGLFYFDADLLKLYLAREGDTWLNSRDADIKAVKAKTIPDRIKNLMQEHLLLDETCRLNNDEYFGDNLERVDRDIHVLVECPDEPDQGIKYKRQDGFDGTLMEDWLSWHLSWSSLQSLFTVEKEKRA